MPVAVGWKLSNRFREGHQKIEGKKFKKKKPNKRAGEKRKTKTKNGKRQKQTPQGCVTDNLVDAMLVLVDSVLFFELF